MLTPTSLAKSSNTMVVEFLTDREIEIMRLFLNPDVCPDQAAIQLGITKRTMDAHMRNIYGKLGESKLRPAVRRFVNLYPQYLNEMVNFFVLPESACRN